MSNLLTTPITAIVYTLILWWFMTGLIMALFKRSQRTIQIGFGIATLAMVGAMVGLVWTAKELSPFAVYVAVTCGTVVWGWHVASYYLGFVTGAKIHSGYRQKTSAPSVLYELNNQVDQRSWKDALLAWRAVLLPDRFRQAVKASLHHELLILLFLVFIGAVTLPHPNRWGLWIFLTLWLMHTSAKLNIFLGVRNFRIDFLPEHLHSLEQFVAKQTSNLFFPFSICIASSTLLFLLYQVIAPTSSAAQSAGAMLIGTMILLGILEHWLLVLPVPVALWGWGVRQLPEEIAQG